MLLAHGLKEGWQPGDEIRMFPDMKHLKNLALHPARMRLQNPTALTGPLILRTRVILQALLAASPGTGYWLFSPHKRALHAAYSIYLFSLDSLRYFYTK